MQLLAVVWAAWRGFVPRSQGKRRVAGAAEAHRRRRALILCFAGWQEAAALRASQRQQLAAALARWDARRAWLALDGWRGIAARRRATRGRLVHGLGRHARGVLAVALRGWGEEVQLQAYRRRVVAVVGARVTNGQLLRAWNGWRCGLQQPRPGLWPGATELAAAAPTCSARSLECPLTAPPWFARRRARPPHCRGEVAYQAARRGQHLLAGSTWARRALSAAFAGWRGQVAYAQARRGQHGLARSTWVLRTQLRAFETWLDATQEAALMRQVRNLGRPRSGCPLSGLLPAAHPPPLAG